MYEPLPWLDNDVHRRVVIYVLTWCFIVWIWIECISHVFLPHGFNEQGDEFGRATLANITLALVAQSDTTPVLVPLAIYS